MATIASHSPPHPANVLGALTFTVYVLSALILTAYVSISLLRSYNTGSHSSIQHARMQSFAIFAFISFATLSYNMLHFLIESYRAWALQQPHPVPLPQGGSGLGEAVTDAWRRVDIWQWLKSSTLFDDFAHEALGSQARSWWTVNALCASINCAVTMSRDGKKHKISRLWAYAAIAQILPVSFAQNLFYFAILLSAPSSPSPLKSSEKSAHLGKTSSSFKTLTASYTKLECVSQIAPFLLYYLLVAIAPNVATSQKYGYLLLLLVGVIRVLLVAPFFSPGTTEATATLKPVARTIEMGSVILFAYQTLAAMRENSGDLVSVVKSLRDNPAVAALGCDWLYSVGSSRAWAWMGAVTEI